MSTFLKYGLFFFVFLGIIGTITQPNKKDDSIISESTVNKEKDKEKSRNDWTCDISIDEMRREATHFAHIKSVKRSRATFSDYAVISLRRSKSKKEVTISSSDELRFSENYATMRIDNGPLVQYKLSLPSSYSSNIRFFNSPVFEKIKKAKVIEIELYFYGGSRQFVFKPNKVECKDV